VPYSHLKKLIRDYEIVIVDNSRAFTAGLKSLLGELESTKIHLFHEAQSALDYMSQNIPDILITDFEISGMHGRDFILSVRSDSKLSEMPILVLTGSEDVETKALCIGIGADAFAVKSDVRNTLIPQLFALARLRETYKGASAGLKLEAVKSLVGTYKHELGNALTIIDGKLRKLIRTNPELEENPDMKSLTNAVDRIHLTLTKLNDLRNYKEENYVGETKLLKVG
jgi:DNA-binding NarL/FixJ family response regulator